MIYASSAPISARTLAGVVQAIIRLQPISWDEQQLNRSGSMIACGFYAVDATSESLAAMMLVRICPRPRPAPIMDATPAINHIGR